jgi:coatomer subunit alpha
VECAVIANIMGDNGLYKLTWLPAGNGAGPAGCGNKEAKNSSTDEKSGSGHSAMFMARNRFTVLNEPG